MEHIDEALQRINDRITLERLSKRVPAVADVINRNARMADVIFRCATVVQTNQLELAVDPDTGLTYDGLDPEEALKAVTHAFQLLRMMAIEVV